VNGFFFRTLLKRGLQGGLSAAAAFRSRGETVQHPEEEGKTGYEERVVVQREEKYDHNNEREEFQRKAGPLKKKGRELKEELLVDLKGEKKEKGSGNPHWLGQKMQ